MRTYRRKPELVLAGCDDCGWRPTKGLALAATRRDCKQHAILMHHSTFVIIGQCSNYDARPRP